MRKTHANVNVSSTSLCFVVNASPILFSRRLTNKIAFLLPVSYSVSIIKLRERALARFILSNRCALKIVAHRKSSRARFLRNFLLGHRKADTIKNIRVAPEERARAHPELYR